MAHPKVPQRTTPGFAFSMIDRSLQDCLARRQFGNAEIEKVLDFFNTHPPECVFCGSKDVKRWDHLVPISKGGETVLGNMVPACARCDDSKRDLHFDEWLTSDTKYSPKSQGIKDIDQKSELIKKYMQHFAYKPTSLEERLDKSELERLNKIRSRLQEIRNEIELLIEGHKKRTK